MSEVTGQGLLGQPGPTRQSPRRHNKNSSGSSATRWIRLLLAAVMTVAVAVAALLFTHPFSHPAGAAGTRSPAHSSQGDAASGAASTGTASPPVGPVGERQAAAS
ncbi:MAG: hypothetical protein M3Z75_32535, partial [Actinomycetota bacterium]|nr:hypothetical protein [Actinomycetota bacterium]